MVALAIESSNHRGMGHLFRSLLLVKYMRNNNIPFTYLINDDQKSKEVLDKEDIPYVTVDYYDEESNWEKDLVEKYKVDVWINDKFETSAPMAKHITDEKVYFALIDDIGPGEKYADVNFVGLIYFSKQTFELKNTQIGMDYVILNDEINQYKRVRDSLGKIIVSFGGSDPNNNTMKIVRELMKYDYAFDVTIGPNYEHEEELKDLNDDRFRIFKGTPSLIKLFYDYDLAITAGGVTCCEANAAGLPCIIVANVPHEINTGKNLEKYGGCLYAGDFEKWDTSILDRLRELDLKQMSEQGMKVFNTDAINKIFDYIQRYKQ